MSADNSRGQLESLLRRSLVQLGEWQRKYGEHNPQWLPPAGDVRLAEDIDTALATPAPSAPGAPQEAAAVPDPWHAAVLAECMLTEACYQEADPAATVKRLIDWHVANGAAVPAVGQEAKDAARYRWLRSQCQKHGGLVIAESDGFGLRSWSGDDPDRAIDAALVGGDGGEG